MYSTSFCLRSKRRDFLNLSIKSTVFRIYTDGYKMIISIENKCPTLISREETITSLSFLGLKRLKDHVIYTVQHYTSSFSK